MLKSNTRLGYSQLKIKTSNRFNLELVQTGPDNIHNQRFLGLFKIFLRLNTVTPGHIFRIHPKWISFFLKNGRGNVSY